MEITKVLLSATRCGPHVVSAALPCAPAMAAASTCHSCNVNSASQRIDAQPGGGERHARGRLLGMVMVVVPLHVF